MTERRLFPKIETVNLKRGVNNDAAAIFTELRVRVSSMISSWADPEIKPWGRVTTRNERAGELLIDALRDEGYAADWHWHGHNEDGGYMVQFALVESELNRAHHDPRRPRQDKQVPPLTLARQEQ